MISWLRAGAQIPSLLLISWVTLGKSLHLSELLLCGMKVFMGPAAQVV